MPTGLQPGDRVIAIAALAQTAGLLGGSFGAAWTSWGAKRTTGTVIMSLLGGAVLGFVVGILTGLALHPTPAGYSFVVKHGVASLSETLPAATLASCVAAIVSSVGISVLLKNAATSSLGACAILGVSVGAVLACLSSLA